MLDRLTQADFAKHLNQSFQLKQDGGAVQLELVEASAIPSSNIPADGQRAPFSLVFRGPAEAPLAQMTYDLEHSAMGEIAMFIVPIGPDAQGLLYEVVFN